jgi:4-hydroxy-2-oxoheptanedioate aldolase
MHRAGSVSTNLLKQRLRAGKACVNGWLSLPSTFVAEKMAQSGWNSLTIDLQHGLQDYQSAVAIIQAIQHYPVTPLVRVPYGEPGLIGKVLDAGAWGIICPMINTAADARAFAQACHYPALGARSYGPIRARDYGGEAPYHEIANDEILVLPQIETREAVDNVTDILDTPGVSGFYVGPGDLGLSLGLPPIMNREEPEIFSIYSQLIREAAQRGLIAGIHTSTPAYAARMIELGFLFVTPASDLGLLSSGALDAVRATRRLAGVLTE